MKRDDKEPTRARMDQSRNRSFCLLECQVKRD